MTTSSSLPQIIDSISSFWSPHLAATVNDHHIKVAKIDGAFIWHAHPNSDELFYLISGKLTLELEDPNGKVVENVLAVGDMFTVPKGVRHKPVAENAVIMMVEKEGTVNTGDQVDSDRTKQVTDARTGA
jgi:mannose-6-phosphate isomerase-like protein (cupin superfamily)